MPSPRSRGRHYKIYPARASREFPAPLFPDSDNLASVRLRRFFTAIRYYWITTKGYRLRPWASPYIRWRMETFYGAEAENLTRAKFLHILWRDRQRMRRFLAWITERHRAQHTPGV